MHRVQFNYSMKNIGIPSRNQYLRNLIDKTKHVVHRMRWKAHFYLRGENRVEENNNYGLRSNKCAPPIKEMRDFEEDLMNLISNITFRNVNDPFLKRVEEDLKKSRHLRIFLFSPTKQQTFTKHLQTTTKSS